MVSCTSGGQNSLIFSKRYCCLSSVRPAGFKMVGNSVDVGCHSFTRVITFSISLQLSFTKTFPGADRWNRKCWYDLIPFRAVWRKWE